MRTAAVALVCLALGCGYWLGIMALRALVVALDSVPS